MNRVEALRPIEGDRYRRTVLLVQDHLVGHVCASRTTNLPMLLCRRHHAAAPAPAATVRGHRGRRAVFLEPAALPAQPAQRRAGRGDPATTASAARDRLPGVDWAGGLSPAGPSLSTAARPGRLRGGRPGAAGAPGGGRGGARGA